MSSQIVASQGFFSASEPFLYFFPQTHFLGGSYFIYFILKLDIRISPDECASTSRVQRVKLSNPLARMTFKTLSASDLSVATRQCLIPPEGEKKIQRSKHSRSFPMETVRFVWIFFYAASVRKRADNKINRKRYQLVPQWKTKSSVAKHL